jgi:hypothetical protein
LSDFSFVWSLVGAQFGTHSMAAEFEGVLREPIFILRAHNGNNNLASFDFIFLDFGLDGFGLDVLFLLQMHAHSPSFCHSS